MPSLPPTYYSILNALQEHRAERKNQASDLYRQQTESVERMEWMAFWDSKSPELMLYACIHGTVEIVKYFVTEVVPPTTRYFLLLACRSPFKLASCQLIHSATYVHIHVTSEMLSIVGKRE